MSGRVTEVVAVSALAAIVTLILAAPVLRAPSERVFGSEIVGRHHDPFTVMELFDRPIALGVYSQPVTDFAGALAARLSGAVAAYNWLVLLSFPLSAATAYLLARHLALTAPAATFAAMAFAFSPFHLAHAAYHPHIAQTQWVPLYLLALWRCLDDATPGAVAFLAAATAGVTLSNFYGGWIAAVITPVAVLAYGYFARSGGGRPTRQLAITVASLLAIAVAGLAYVGYAARAVAVDRAAFGFPRVDLFRYSARWWSYLVPPVENPLLGASVLRFWRATDVRGGLLEQQVSLGWGVVALGLVAVFSWLRRGRRTPGRSRIRVLVIVAFAALVCSLSPERKIGAFTFVRPSAWLYAVAPMFRAYARFGVVVQLMAVLLAGFGVDTLRRGATGARIACVALVALSAGEYAVAPTALWRDTLPTTAHRWIARQSAPLRALDCAPLTPDSASVEWLTKGRISLRSAPFDDCTDPDLAARLGAAGYTHLLVRRGTWESRWLARHAPRGLRSQPRFDDADLFVVGPPRETVYTAELRAFSGVEHDEDSRWRWMGQDASWRVVSPGVRTRTAEVEVELFALGTVRRLEVLLDGREVQSLRVENARRLYRIGPLVLAPGSHELAFHPIDPPTIADELLGNGDRRPLSVAFGAWRWTAPGEQP